MRVVCLIDSLGSGGAQRQLCMLAVLLKKQGMDISVLTYHPHDFFLPLLQEAGIKYTCLHTRSIPHHILAVRRTLRRGDHDVVLAFMRAPSLYAELAAIPRRRWGLVVSERDAIPATFHSRLTWLRRFHRIADYVVTNSLTNRIVTIYNAVDLEAFSPSPLSDVGGDRGFRMVVAARYEPQKNPSGLVGAVALAREKAPSLSIQLDWYGHYGTAVDRKVYSQAQQLVEQHGLRECVRLHGESRTITAEYGSAHAVALPSFFEGLPNTVCEAMACGRPILMSDVCDAGNLVKNGHNGFLFDPFSPEDIARAILEFAALNVTERESMGRRSREMAERMFDPVVVAARYAEILSAAATRKRLPIEHWIPDVPDSAYRSLD
jgi:glycosyltransferase involved in cell wall biosynthesis